MNRSDKIDEIKRQKYFVRGDIAVFAAALLLIAACLLFAFLPAREEGEQFSVYYRGELIFTAPLEQDAAYLFCIAENGARVVPYSGGEAPEEAYNVIEVSGGYVRVSEANCPDGTCMAFGARDWGDILCLPHDLRITVTGKGLVTDV